MKHVTIIITVLALAAIMAALVVLLFTSHAHAAEPGQAMPAWMQEPQYRASLTHTLRTGDEFSYDGVNAKTGVTTMAAQRMVDMEVSYTELAVDDDEVENGYFPDRVYEELLFITIAGQTDLYMIGAGSASDVFSPKSRNSYAYGLAAWSVWTASGHDLKLGIGGASLPVIELLGSRRSVIPVAQYTYTGQKLQVDIGIKNGFTYRAGAMTYQLAADLSGQTTLKAAYTAPWRGTVSLGVTQEGHGFFIDGREERLEVLEYEHTAVELAYEQPLSPMFSVSASVAAITDSEYATVDSDERRNERDLGEGALYRAGLSVHF